MIRVCVVDDQTLVRQGICTLLGLVEGIEVVGEAEDGEQALVVIPRLAPDVVLLDLRMPVMGGLRVLETLSAAGALPPTIILTTFDDDALVLAGLRAGAKGFLLKDVSLERLAQAIRTAASGGTMVQPGLTERILNAALHPMASPSLGPADPLTPRETEVLRLLAGGYTNREIAEALGTAEGTVKNQISSILSKLGVRDRTQAVLRGIEERLV